MKKKAALTALALCTAASMNFAASAYADEMDAEDIIQKVSEASEVAGTISADAGVNCSMAFYIGEEGNVSKISAIAAADISLECMEDPFVLGLDGTFSVSTMGQNISLIVKVYECPNSDGDYNLYIYTEDTSEEDSGEWTVELISAEDMDLEALDFAEGSSDIGVSFLLNEETADYEGTECYLLETVIDLDALYDSLTEAIGGEVTEEIADEAGISTEDIREIVESIAINMVYYIDTETYLPVFVHFDLNDTDFSFLNEYIRQALGEGYETAELVFNDLSFDVAFSFDDIEEIAIPEEALLAEAVEGESLYIDDDSEEAANCIYMVEETGEDTSFDLITSVTIDGTDYTMPVNYDVLTDAGWYTEDTGEVYMLELLNDSYPDASCYVRWLTDDYDDFMPDEIAGQEIGYLELMEAYDAEMPGKTNITFSGIGLGSSYEDVINTFGLPAYCAYIGFSDTEVAYDYTLFVDDGTYYSLDFYIDSDGLVSIIDFGIY